MTSPLPSSLNPLIWSIIRCNASRKRRHVQTAEDGQLSDAEVDERDVSLAVSAMARMAEGIVTKNTAVARDESPGVWNWEGGGV